MVWTAMLTAALLAHEDGHLRLTFLTEVLPPAMARVVLVIADLVVLCFLALLGGASLVLMPSVSQQNTVTLGVSMIWFYAALPICSALMFLLTLRTTIRRFIA
jgi:TRAP-type C4-dicarboxylate transport system permease small subunit